MIHLFSHKNDIDRVYEKYSDSLYRLALARLLNAYDAEDAVHDVFSAYISKKPQLNGEIHEKAWFVRSTINRCNDILRKQKVRKYVPLDEALGLKTSDDKSFLEVAELLKKLSDDYRETVILHYLEGYTLEETAEILEISLSAAKMRISRAKEILRKDEQ